MAMKKLIALLLAISFLLTTTLAYAEYVRGYYRSNGTYVQGYNRSDRNATVRDNYSYKGNVNPYTGKTGTNYYRNSPSSEYYDPYSDSSSGSSSSSDYNYWE